jgi:hypothetical protein
LKARKLWGVREDAARVKIVCSVVRLKEWGFKSGTGLWPFKGQYSYVLAEYSYLPQYAIYLNMQCFYLN